MAKQKQKGLQLIDVPLYSIWQAVFYSFFKSDLYVDVAKRWKGFALSYLALICAIASIPLSIKWIPIMSQFYRYELIEPIRQIPKFYMMDGKLSLSANENLPYFIKNRQGKEVIALMQEGNLSVLSRQYPNLYLLITDNKAMLRLMSPKDLSGREIIVSDKVYEFDFKGQSFVFDIQEWLKEVSLKPIFILFEISIFPCIWGSLLAAYSILIFSFSLINQLLAKLLIGLHLTYKQVVRVFTVAITPQLFAMTIGLTWDRAINYLAFLSIILFFIYTSFAALVLKKQKNHLARQ